MDLSFHSNGKLLLTGEYVVLDGAKALALPTKKGQSLLVKTNQTGVFSWTSYDCHQHIWYSSQIETIQFFKTTPPKGSSKFDETLFKILWNAQQINPQFLDKRLGYQISTFLEFERLWGLGTSSTLINNIAKWACINPFKLLNNSFGGSGYDIAAAEATTPIFYQRNSNLNRPSITKATAFNPPFKDRLFFIYLKEKKDSKEAIKNYRSQSKGRLALTIQKINKLTEQIALCSDFPVFESLLNEHEKTIAKILNCPTIQQERFNDYTGVVKSLGGWGGDFVLATGNVSKMDYFYRKGYQTIVPYNKMIF